MLWSTLGKDGYTMGLARSTSGDISGPWDQLPEPLWTEDGGHGMLFRSFEGQLYLTLHQPNNTPEERPHFFEIKETKDNICLK